MSNYDKDSPILFLSGNTPHGTPILSLSEMSALYCLWDSEEPIEKSDLIIYGNRHRRRIGLGKTVSQCHRHVTHLMMAGLTSRKIIHHTEKGARAQGTTVLWKPEVTQAEILEKLLNGACLLATEYTFPELLYRYVNGQPSNENMEKLFSYWDKQEERVHSLLTGQSQTNLPDTRAEPQDAPGEEEQDEGG